MQLTEFFNEVRVRFLHVVFVEALVGEDFEQVVVRLRKRALDVFRVLRILPEEFRGALMHEVFRQFVDYLVHRFTATFKLLHFEVVFLLVRFVVFVFGFVLLLVRLVFGNVAFEFGLECE